jgi:hypothetical protein
MKYRVTDHEVKMYCEYHQQYLSWAEFGYDGDDDGEGGPLDPMRWSCPGLSKQLIGLNACQDAIDRKAVVPLGKDYPVGATRRVPMQEWPQELLDAWAKAEDTKDDAECLCRESWEIEIVPINQT